MRGRIKGKGGVQVKEIANTVTKKDVGGKGTKNITNISSLREHQKLEGTSQRVGVEGARPREQNHVTLAVERVPQRLLTFDR